VAQEQDLQPPGDCARRAKLLALKHRVDQPPSNLRDRVETPVHLAAVIDILLDQECVLSALAHEIARLKTQVEALRSGDRLTTPPVAVFGEAGVEIEKAVEPPKSAEVGGRRATQQAGVTKFLRAARLTGAETDQTLQRVKTLLAIRTGRNSRRGNTDG
jgi:hypothetical protein